MTSKASTFLSHIICFTGCKKCLLSIAYGSCKFSPAEAGMIEATWKDLYRVSWKCYFLIAHGSSREMPTPLNPQEPSKKKPNDLPEALISDWSYNSFRSDIFCSICVCVLWASMPYIYTPWYASTTAVQWNLVISHRHQCHTVLHTATYLRNSFYPIHVSLIMALHMTICIKRSSESLTYRLGGTGQLMPKTGSNMLFWIIPARSYHWLCDLYVYTPLSITTWMVHFVEKFQYW